MGGFQGRSRQVRKISPTPGLDPRTVHPVGSRYIFYATRPKEGDIKKTKKLQVGEGRENMPRKRAGDF